MEPHICPEEIHQTIAGVLLDTDSASVISLAGVSKYWRRLGLASVKHIASFSPHGFPFGVGCHGKDANIAAFLLTRSSARSWLPTGSEIPSVLEVRTLRSYRKAGRGSGRSIATLPSGRIAVGLLVCSPEGDAEVSVRLLCDASLGTQKYVLEPTRVPRWHCYLLVRLYCTLPPPTLMCVPCLGIECSEASAKLALVCCAPST